MLIPKSCERCNKESRRKTCSRFNIQMICMECNDKEKKHAKYKLACEVEFNEVKKGNFNFEGIGLPSDLYTITIKK
jgi:hypothetical protein